MKRLLAALATIMMVAAVPVMAEDAAAPATPAPASDKSSDTMQALRDKLKADKKLVVAEAMQLSQTESAAFWPVYESYQKDLTALNQRTMKMIKDYADGYGSMTDPIAKGLVDSFLKIEKDRIALMQTYTPKFRKVLPEIKVARYWQVENKIRAVVNYELAYEIPLAE